MQMVFSVLNIAKIIVLKDDSIEHSLTGEVLIDCPKIVRITTKNIYNLYWNNITNILPEKQVNWLIFHWKLDELQL